jgi:hypothetical protein
MGRFYPQPENPDISIIAYGDNLADGIYRQLEIDGGKIRINNQEILRPSEVRTLSLLGVGLDHQEAAAVAGSTPATLLVHVSNASIAMGYNHISRTVKKILPTLSRAFRLNIFEVEETAPYDVSGFTEAQLRTWHTAADYLGKTAVHDVRTHPEIREIPALARTLDMTLGELVMRYHLHGISETQPAATPQ